MAAADRVLSIGIRKFRFEVPNRKKRRASRGIGKGIGRRAYEERALEAAVVGDVLGLRLVASDLQTHTTTLTTIARFRVQITAQHVTSDQKSSGRAGVRGGRAARGTRTCRTAD